MIAPAEGEPYGRAVVEASDDHEVLLMRWRAGATCAPHDHADAGGVIHIVSGSFVERRYQLREGELFMYGEKRISAPAVIMVGPGTIHDMKSEDGGTTVHVYRPRITGMRVYDTERREVLVVDDDCGAWIPRDDAHVRSRRPW
jgi:predicted metal-dependent enzyme (double-stranded beta helix superfamily)